MRPSSANGRTPDIPACLATILSRFGLLLSGVLLSSCVILPYTPSAETVRSPCPMPLEEKVQLNIGPRHLLDEVAGEIQSRLPAMVEVDRLEFRDAAFPDGGWTLGQLLDGEQGCRNLPQPADYLVLIGQPQYDTVDSKGGVAFYLGFFGAGKSTSTGDFSALVIDLRHCCPVNVVTAESEGTNLGAGLFYGLFIYPMVDRSVLDGLGRGVADLLAESSSGAPLRVVVMAAESGDRSNFLLRSTRPE